MNLIRLYAILSECTIQLRKGEPVVERTITDEAHQTVANVTEVYMMPHTGEVTIANLEKVDCHFVVVGVHKPTAEKYRAEFIELLRAYPEPERLAGGPSYIEVGAVVGDQAAAFQLFALGQVLGLWQVITPARLKITGPDADQMAGAGFVMTTGFKEVNSDVENAAPQAE